VLRELGTSRDASLSAALARIRRDGHAFSTMPGRLQGIAVPIRTGPRVLGCISMRFTRSSMTDAAAGERFGAALTALAKTIAANISEADISEARP
jgi:DNA-binding IclR family transcriptional regulator